MNPSGGTTEPPEVTRARLNRLHLRRPVRRELRHEDVLRIAHAWRWFADNERYPGEAGRLSDFLGWSEHELDAYERQHGVPLVPRHDSSGPARARPIRGDDGNAIRAIAVAPATRVRRWPPRSRPR